MIEQVSRWAARGFIGGVVECGPQRCLRLGSPVFDKLEADIAKGVMSLPATKGFEMVPALQGHY